MTRLGTALTSALLLVGLCLPALAEPPASIPVQDAAQRRASRSFDRFATGWMKKMKRAQESGRKQIKAQGSYRGFADSSMRMQLRPTGSSKAPYVGLLRYQEQQIRCKDPKARKGCKVISTTPVTEIFRFQNGHWVY